MIIKAQNGTECQFCAILCHSVHFLRMRKECTEWHRMTQNDNEKAKNSTELLRRLK